LIKKATVDFGATDMPLDPKELEKLGMIQFPIVIGGVVPVVNIDGVKPGQIHFTGEVLAASISASSNPGTIPPSARSIPT